MKINKTSITLLQIALRTYLNYFDSKALNDNIDFNDNLYKGASELKNISLRLYRHNLGIKKELDMNISPQEAHLILLVITIELKKHVIKLNNNWISLEIQLDRTWLQLPKSAIQNPNWAEIKRRIKIYHYKHPND